LPCQLIRGDHSYRIKLDTPHFLSGGSGWTRTNDPRVINSGG